jgi:hypothetical protein
MPNSTVDENYEYYGDENPPYSLETLPPRAEEYVTPRTPIIGSTAESVTTPQEKNEKIYQYVSMISSLHSCAHWVIVPVLQPPEGLTTHQVRNAEELGTYVESALDLISPNKVCWWKKLSTYISLKFLFPLSFIFNLL